MKNVFKTSLYVFLVGLICLFLVPFHASAEEAGLLRNTGVKQFGIGMDVTTIPATPANAPTTGVLTDGDTGWYNGGWYNKHVFDLGENKLHTITSYQLSVGQAISNSLEFYDQTGTLITSVVIDQHKFNKTDIAPVSGVRYVVLKTGNWIGELEVYGSLDSTNNVPEAVTDLNAASKTSSITLNWSTVPKTTGYNISRSTVSGGPYTVLASNVTGNTYDDTSVLNGVTYYYVIAATNENGQSGYSNEAAATVPVLKPQLNVVIAEEKVNVGQEFTSNIVLKNVKDIYAEDFTIQYDNVHLEYLGFEEVSGYKVYNTPTDNNGTLRFVVASQGAAYGINAETTFLKLKFKAKAVGTGKVDGTKARIADTTTEFDLEEANCLEDTVIIENQDVNMSGEYTLLDLAIDGAHFGELGSTVDPTKYVANQVGDDTIRDEDLVFIVAQMLANTNYAPNNK
jgi:hypothetical protein